MAFDDARKQHAGSIDGVNRPIPGVMRHPRDRQHASPPAVTGSQTVPAAELLTTLAHELRNLLDGSLRCLGNAERLLDGETVDGAARDQVATARGALERMSGLLGSAMFQTPGAIGSPEMNAGRAIALGEAIEHAAEVMRPLASASRVEIITTLDPRAAARPCGTLYPLILNAIRNAVESIASVRSPEPISGLVAVVLTESEDGGVVLRVLDDGVGPPAIDEQRLFEHGVTSKPQGHGIGLAVCRMIVSDLPGGTITLHPRPERRGEARPGAVLEVRTGPEAS